MNRALAGLGTRTGLGVLLVTLAAGSACGDSIPSATGPPQIRLVVPAGNEAAAFIEVRGLSASELDRLRAHEMTDAAWAALLRVTVKADAVVDPDDRPAMLGTYTVQSDTLRFTPRYPFDAGRPYQVVFDASRLPLAQPAGSSRAPVVAVVSRPKTAAAPSTRVAQVYPTADQVPENQLRLYVQFSAPMGRRSGLEHVHLLDPDGREVKDPFLPLDLEFWNGDHTRYTFFLDPGRVKKGITPREEMGPSLVAGRRYTLVIDKDWLDAEGMPLSESFRRQLTVTAPDEKALDPGRWRITAPTAGTRDALVVDFDKPLDHGLLLRALGVRRGKNDWVMGEVRIEASETRWVFTPADPWSEGSYHLVALSILEDRAGNRIGRAFEVDRFDEIDSRAEPEETLLPFSVASRPAS